MIASFCLGSLPLLYPYESNAPSVYPPIFLATSFLILDLSFPLYGLSFTLKLKSSIFFSGVLGLLSSSSISYVGSIANTGSTTDDLFNETYDTLAFDELPDGFYDIFNTFKVGYFDRSTGLILITPLT